MLLFARKLSLTETTPIQQHQAAHALLADALQEVYGLPMPDICIGEHGKPWFPAHPEIQFNLSHCRGLVLCGLDAFPLGVDGERIRPLRTGALRRAFSPEEQQLVQNAPNPDKAFFQLWTKKESLVKALGIGISYPLQSVAFLDLQPETGTLDCPQWQFRQFLLEEQWVIACCGSIRTEMPERLLLRG